MNAIETNREIYLIIDTRNAQAFEATAFWSSMYVAEQGYRVADAVDAAGCHGSVESGLFVIPTGRQSERDVTTSLDYSAVAGMYQIFA